MIPANAVRLNLKGGSGGIPRNQHSTEVFFCSLTGALRCIETKATSHIGRPLIVLIRDHPVKISGVRR